MLVATEEEGEFLGSRAVNPQHAIAHRKRSPLEGTHIIAANYMLFDNVR